MMTVLWMPRLNPPASPAKKSQPHLSVRRQSSTDSHTIVSIPAAGRVQFGDDRPPPEEDAGRQRGRSQQSRRPPAAHQPHDQVNVRNRQRAEESRHQVDAVGDIPKGQEGEQLAEDDLRGVAAGMRHPQRVGERLEFGDVPVQQRRRQRADVQRQAQGYR